eukprot:Tbor_TRINITY_DN3754_c0_g1::TRINITY_DN3754_c0_g1_i1::g.2398::m.2398
MNKAVAQKHLAEATIAKVRRLTLLLNGENGIRGLSRAFNVMDDDGNQKLTKEEFSTGMKKIGINLSTDEVKAVWAYFDRNADGEITTTEFITALRGGLNPLRRSHVYRVFDMFDKNSDGSISVDDMRRRFDASRHPAVIKGQLTADEVLEKFHNSFDNETNPDGIITKQEFEQYYAGVSSSIDNDDYFMAILRGCWRLPGTNDDATFTMAVEAQGGDIRMEAMKSNPTALTETLKSSIPDSKQLKAILSGTIDLKTLKSMKKPTTTTTLKAMPTTTTTSTYDSGIEGQGRTWGVHSFGTAQNIYEKEELIDMITKKSSFDELIKHHRDVMLSHKMGFRGVGRLLRKCDVNNSKYISQADFIECLRQNRLYVEDRTLFKFLDTNLNGSIDYDLYLHLIMGELPPARQLLMEQLWRRLPTDAQNRTDLSIIHRTYQAPDGITLNTFLSAWDARLVPDGKVRFTELLEWIIPFSEKTPSDGVFENIIKSQWEIQ